jgi:paraquat-inducible protein B
LVLVSDSIRGLKVGAPVEYRGVLVGHVASTNLLQEQSLATSEILEEDFKIPVLISLQPGRVNLPDSQEGLLLLRQQNFYWIRQGLKAALKSGNLITGSLFVELQHHNDKPVKQLTQFSGYPVIPRIGNDFAQITAKANQFINTLNKLPLEKITNSGDALLVESVQTLKEIKSLSRNVKKLVSSIENDKLSNKMADTLDNLTQLSTDYSKGSKTYEELLRSLTSLTSVMYELKPLLNQVNQQPNSLIFNSGKGVSIEPKKHRGSSQ